MLIEDDEGIVCLLFSEAFKALGYQTMCSHSPYKAIQYYKDNWRRIDYVVLAENGTSMSGREIYRALARVNPEAEAVLTHEVTGSETVLDVAPIVFVRKPRFAADLFKMLRGIFNVDKAFSRRRKRLRRRRAARRSAA